MSLWLQVLVYSVMGVAGLAVMVALFRTRRPVRSLAGSSAQGICALAAVNIAGIFTGISLGLNLLTFITCAALGIPGVIMLLLLKLLFNM